MHFFYSFSVQYVVFLYRYLKEWRTNPRCSFSCCLALLLPFNDLQGDIRGCADAGVFKSQLQTEEIEVPTIITAVKNSEAKDAPFGESQEDDDSKLAVAVGKENTKSRSHQGTQTEIFKLSINRMENEIRFDGILSKKAHIIL